MTDLIAIVGQTATGKSQLAMRITQRFSGEIIAADSRTIYKGLDIGTAKPSLDDRRIIRHYMLDLVLPAQYFSVVDFQRLAFSALDDIQARGKLPLLVGGSGLYVNSILYNYSFSGTGRDTKLRQRLATMTVEQLQAYSRTSKLPMPTNAKNKRYLIRNIERARSLPADQELRPKTLVIGLKLSKSVLEARIRARLQGMLEAGLLAETEHLINNCPVDSEALKSNIYRALLPYFQNQKSLDDSLEACVRLDLKLAKKQLTWFKRDTNIVWFEDSLDDAYGYVCRHLQK